MNTVNSELFNKIADSIEAEPNNYCQLKYGWCGTPGCIAGWAVVLTRGSMPKFDVDKYTGIDVEREASNALGLSETESFRLFDGAWKPHPGLTVPEALRMIANGSSVSEVSQ